MTVNEKQYEEGDWLVHLIYGVGQIQRLEKKPIGGASRLCYRVQTGDGVFWLPADNADNKRVRPLASPKRIQRALEALKRAPRKMAKNFQSRRKRIREVSLDGSLRTDLKLVRDLNGRQHRKGLNMTEQHAFDALIERFLQEWSLSKGIDLPEARIKLNHFLEESWEQRKQTQNKVAA